MEGGDAPIGMAKLAGDIVKCGAVRLRGSARWPAPTLFSLPGLTARADWGGAAGLARAGHEELALAVRAVEASAAVIVDEYDTAAATRARDGRAASDYAAEPGHALSRGRWDWVSYVDKGAVVPEFGRDAPATAALLERVPRLMTGSPFGFAFFSSLAPGADIAPHCAPMNLRLRVHVPLRVPAGDVGFGLAGEAVRWREGEALVFDDSYVHHAWNRGAGDRVLLLFDVWHPDLRDDEVAALRAMLPAPG